MFTTETNSGGVAATGSEARLPASHVWEGYLQPLVPCSNVKLMALLSFRMDGQGLIGGQARKHWLVSAEDSRKRSWNSMQHLGSAGSCWHRENHEMEAVLLYRLAWEQLSRCQSACVTSSRMQDLWLSWWLECPAPCSGLWCNSNVHQCVAFPLSASFFPTYRAWVQDSSFAMGRALSNSACSLLFTGTSCESPRFHPRLLLSLWPRCSFCSSGFWWWCLCPDAPMWFQLCLSKILPKSSREVSLLVFINVSLLFCRLFALPVVYLIIYQ